MNDTCSTGELRLASPARAPRVAHDLLALAYEPAVLPPWVDLRLDGNEGRAPAPPFAAFDGELLRRYPDVRALQTLLARRHGVAAERVLVTAGADDALDRICRAVLAPGRTAVLPEPTFVMLRRYIALAGGERVVVPWPGGEFPRAEVAAAIDARTALVFVVSPNNPTGAVASRADLEALSAAAPDALIVLDAAYGEFATDDLTPLALELPNVVVVRTLSKAYGLAGCRVGYAIAPDATLARCLAAAGSPYPVAAPSLALAAARLLHDPSPFVAEVRAEVHELTQQLVAFGLDVARSEANFVLARGPRAPFLHAALRALGIAVRRFDGEPSLGSAVRITCPGERRALVRLSAALATAFAPDTLLFDLDGVLADVSRSYRVAIVRTAQRFGAEVTAADIDARKALGDANDDFQVTCDLVRARGLPADYAAVASTFQQLYDDGLWRRETLLLPRTQLLELRRRFRVGIVTGRPTADAERFLVHHGLQDCFDAVVCREHAPCKPDPAPVRLALDRLGGRRAWLFGDTPDDVAAARGAAVLPIGVVPPNGGDAVAASLDAAGAARVLRRTTDLDRLLPGAPTP